MSLHPRKAMSLHPSERLTYDIAIAMASTLQACPRHAQSTDDCYLCLTDPGAKVVLDQGAENGKRGMSANAVTAQKRRRASAVGRAVPARTPRGGVEPCVIS